MSNSKYNPKKEVIDFLRVIYKHLESEGSLEDHLSVLSQGEITDLESAMNEVNSGTVLGRVLYMLGDHVYNNYGEIDPSLS
jgi:hypothetical protein